MARCLFKICITAALFLQFGSFPCAQSQQAAPRSDQDPTRLVNIEFKEDIRVFTVMAAINAAGFDYELKGRQMSEVRQSVRQALQGMDSALLAKLKALYEHQASTVRPSNQHVAYTSLALILGDPPEFALAAKDEDLPGDTWRVREIGPLLQEFYIKAGISKLWEEHRSRYSAELEEYIPVLRRAIRSTLDYFGVPLRVMMDRRIILIPDLLNAHDIVNARNLERIYYIVVGPTDRPSGNFNQLHHEYLHSLVDPLVAKYGAVLLEHDKLLNLAQAQPHIRSDIQNSYILVVTESFIEAIQLRMRKPSPDEADRRLVRLVREGLIFAPLFYRELEEYEENEMVGLPAYVELIFKKVNKSAVDKDLKAIDQLEAEIAEKQRQAQEAIDRHNLQARQHNRRVALLRQAGQLMSAHKFPEAEAKLRELLEEDPGNGNASFYMAQILSQTGRHEDAFQWYKRSAESDADPQVRAWSWLRMGRIAAAGQRFREARGYFEKVLTIEGELGDADQQARDLIGQLPPP